MEVIFPCTAQTLSDFIGEVIGKHKLVKINFIDGTSVIHSYKDFLWVTRDEYPLVILGEGTFDLKGKEGNKDFKIILSMEIVNNWLGE